MKTNQNQDYRLQEAGESAHKNAMVATRIEGYLKLLFIQMLFVSIFILPAGSLKAQYGPGPGLGRNMTYIPSNGSGGQFVDRLAQTGQYRICTPNITNRSYGFNANIGYGPLSGGYNYSQSSGTRNWDCGRQIPSPGSYYYMQDYRRQIYSDPRVYQGR